MTISGEGLRRMPSRYKQLYLSGESKHICFTVPTTKEGAMKTRIETNSACNKIFNQRKKTDLEKKIPGTVELEMQASIHPKPSLLEQAAERGKGEKEEQSCPA